MSLVNDDFDTSTIVRNNVIFLIVVLVVLFMFLTIECSRWRKRIKTIRTIVRQQQLDINNELIVAAEDD